MSLYLLEGKELEMYNAALASLGHSKAKDNVMIDKAGYCQDMDAPKGVIIVSSTQGKADLIKPRYSFMQSMLDDLYEKEKSSIQFFCQARNHEKREALIGSLKITVEKMGYKATLMLETATKKIEKIRSLIKRVNDIDEQPEIILQKDFVRLTLEKVLELNNEYQAFNDAHSRNFNVHQIMPSYKYCDQEEEKYFLNNGSPICIFFGKPVKKELPAIQYISGEKDKDDVLNDLLEKKYIIFDEQRVEQLIKELQDEVLKGKGLQPDKLNTMEYYGHLKGFKSKGEFPQKLNALLAAQRNHTALDQLSLESKTELLRFPDDDLLIELINKIIKKASPIY